MTAHLLVLIAAGFLGGFGRRIAGGILNELADCPPGVPLMGDTPARLIYGTLMGAAAFSAGAAWWQALAMIPAVWAGTTTGNFGSIAMGRGTTSYWHDFAGMSMHALLSALGPLLVVLLPSFWVFWHGAPYAPPVGGGWLLACTMLAAPLYSLGWIISGRRGRDSFPLGLRGGSELGEFFWGNACGIGIAMAFLP